MPKCLPPNIRAWSACWARRRRFRAGDCAVYAELLAENIQRRRVEKELRASQTSH